MIKITWADLMGYIALQNTLVLGLRILSPLANEPAFPDKLLLSLVAMMTIFLLTGFFATWILKDSIEAFLSANSDQPTQSQCQQQASPC